MIISHTPPDTSTTIVTCLDRLDAPEARLLRLELHDALSSDYDVVADVRHCDVVDAVGFAALVSGQRAASSVGTRFAVAHHVGDATCRMIQLHGFRHHLTTTNCPTKIVGSWL